MQFKGQYTCFPGVLFVSRPALDQDPARETLRRLNKSPVTLGPAAPEQR